MATLTYDFEDDTLAASPEGWSFLYATDTYDEEVAFFSGSKRYWFNASALNRVVSNNTDAGAAVADVIMSGTFYRTNDAVWSIINLRHDGSPFATENGYGIGFGNNTVAISESTNGSNTTLGTATKTLSAATLYNFKVEAVGTTIRAKIWSGAEPGWDVSVVDSDHASGYVELGSYHFTTYYDDITIISGDIVINVDVTPGVGTVEIAGYDPVVIAPSTLIPDTGALAVAGLEPVVKVDRGVDQSPPGTVGVAGYDPVVFAASATPLGTLSVSGKAPVVFAGTDVLQKSFFGVDVEILSFNPTVAGFPINVYPTLGTLSITGYDPTVISKVAVAQDPLGTVSITGYDPVVTLPNIAAPAGSVVITGFNPTVAATASTVHLYFKFKDAAGNVWTREIDRVPPLVETDANRIASSTDEVVVMDATGGDLTYTLPTLTGRNGFVYEVKKSDSSANTVTLVGTIDNDANFILTAQDECVTVKGGTSTWWIST